MGAVAAGVTKEVGPAGVFEGRQEFDLMRAAEPFLNGKNVRIFSSDCIKRRKVIVHAQEEPDAIDCLFVRVVEGALGVECAGDSGGVH